MLLLSMTHHPGIDLIKNRTMKINLIHFKALWFEKTSFLLEHEHTIASQESFLNSNFNGFFGYSHVQGFDNRGRAHCRWEISLFFHGEALRLSTATWCSWHWWMARNISRSSQGPTINSQFLNRRRRTKIRRRRRKMKKRRRRRIKKEKEEKQEEKEEEEEEEE